MTTLPIEIVTKIIQYLAEINAKEKIVNKIGKTEKTKS